MDDAMRSALERTALEVARTKAASKAAAGRRSAAVRVAVMSGASLAEVAEVAGLTRERVRQIARKAEADLAEREGRAEDGWVVDERVSRLARKSEPVLYGQWLEWLLGVVDPGAGPPSEVRLVGDNLRVLHRSAAGPAWPVERGYDVSGNPPPWWPGR